MSKFAHMSDEEFRRHCSTFKRKTFTINAEWQKRLSQIRDKGNPSAIEMYDVYEKFMDEWVAEDEAILDEKLRRKFLKESDLTVAQAYERGLLS